MTINSNKQIKQSNRSSIQTKRRGKHLPGTYSCSCSCQGVQRSNKQAANKSEHRKWDNKFKQTNRAIELNKQTNKFAKGSIYLALALALALVKASRQAVFKQASGKQKRESKVRQQIQTKKSSNQTDQTNKIDKRQRFLLFRTTICSAWLSRLKEMPLQLLPKIAKMTRLVLSANRRPGIRPGPADGPGPSGGRQTATPSETY